MGNSLNIAGNRVVNTAAIPVRVVGTAVTTVSDLGNTLYTMSKESYEIMADTTKNVKNTLLGAWNHGKRYHKAMNIPLSPVIAAGSALEGVVRSTVQPLINGIVNIRNTGKNTVKNARRGTFGRVFSKKPISDFSYDHMQTRGLKLNNRISKWQFGKGTSKKNEQIEEKKEMKNNKEEKKEEIVADKPMETFDKDNKWGEDTINKKDEEIKLLKKQLDDANKKSNQEKGKVIEMKNNKEEKKRRK